MRAPGVVRVERNSGVREGNVRFVLHQPLVQQLNDMACVSCQGKQPSLLLFFEVEEAEGVTVHKCLARSHDVGSGRVGKKAPLLQDNPYNLFSNMFMCL
eukprot:12929916-Prorocentrum_lima.AAC.1